MLSNKKNQKKIINILFSGLGGQGIILACDIGAETFLMSGYDVKISFEKGIAQRNDIVCAHLRAGDKIYSPVIQKGKCDILFAMGVHNVAMHADKLRKNGLIISLVRTYGMRAYHKRLIQKIKKKIKNSAFISYPNNLGPSPDKPVLNLFMLGCLSNYLPINMNTWLKAIRRKIPVKMLFLNIAAFKTGHSGMNNFTAYE